MGKLEAFGVCSGLLCLAAVAAVDAAPRGAYFAPGRSAPRAPEIMLYFSHAVGGAGEGGSMRPTFGLRLQQVHQAANTGDPEQGESMQHRELISWQFDAHSNLRPSQSRVKLGNKLTYDFASSRFGAPSRSVMQIGTPSLRAGVVNPVGVRPFGAPDPARGFAGTGRGRESNRDYSSRDNLGRDNPSMHEIAAAAIAALAPAHLTAAQRRLAQRQNGITAVAAAQRMQAATALH